MPVTLLCFITSTFRLVLFLSSVSAASLLLFEAVAWAVASARVLRTFVMAPEGMISRDTLAWEGQGSEDGHHD